MYNKLISENRTRQRQTGFAFFISFLKYEWYLSILYFLKKLWQLPLTKLTTTMYSVAMWLLCVQVDMMGWFPGQGLA